jgi:hypothetical protein
MDCAADPGDQAYGFDSEIGLNPLAPKMSRGKEHKLILTRLGQDLARIEKTLGYSLRSTRNDGGRQTSERVRPYRERSTAAKRRRK